MNGEGDSLRASTPIYSAKDVLVSLDRKVGEMDTKIDGIDRAMGIILSQDLNARLVLLEREGSKSARDALALAVSHEQQWQQLKGTAVAVKMIIGTNVLTFLVGAAALAKAMGII